MFWWVKTVQLESGVRSQRLHNLAIPEVQFVFRTFHEHHESAWSRNIWNRLWSDFRSFRLFWSSFQVASICHRQKECTAHSVSFDVVLANPVSNKYSNSAAIRANKQRRVVVIGHKFAEELQYWKWNLRWSPRCCWQNYFMQKWNNDDGGEGSKEPWRSRL